MARSSIRYEVLGNEVRFNIYESKPDRMPDHEWSVLVGLPNLKDMPTLDAVDEAFWLPAAAAWIGFRWTSQMELGAGVNIHDDVCHGPFRLLTSPPSDVDLEQAR